VKLFGSTHSAHCFVYADYGIEQTALKQELVDEKYAFRGYSTLSRVPVTETDFTPQGRIPHIRRHRSGSHKFAQKTKARPYGFIEILARKPEFDDTHGAARLAILFLGSDGVVTYDSLFCQDRSPPLYAALIADYGFDANYTKFGRGGLMEANARRTGHFRKFIVCPPGSEWANYAEIPGPRPNAGGMHRNSRHLYEQK